jgi:hypothetical protein
LELVMKIKSNDLVGPALDWAVAKCENKAVRISKPYAEEPPMVLFDSATEYHPSTNWSQGGLIIERERINLNTEDEDDGDNDWQWLADPHQAQDLTCRRYGPTPLIAAMRCYVASRLGEEVDVPEELE